MLRRRHAWLVDERVLILRKSSFVWFVSPVAGCATSSLRHSHPSAKLP